MVEEPHTWEEREIHVCGDGGEKTANCRSKITSRDKITSSEYIAQLKKLLLSDLGKRFCLVV